MVRPFLAEVLQIDSGTMHIGVRMGLWDFFVHHACMGEYMMLESSYCTQTCQVSLISSESHSF